MSNIPRTVDGVVLESRDERDEECVITFKTESILEKFILKFDRLHMDCHDHLYIYDGAHATGAYRVGTYFLSDHFELEVKNVNSTTKCPKKYSSILLIFSSHDALYNLLSSPL